MINLESQKQSSNTYEEFLNKNPSLRRIFDFKTILFSDKNNILSVEESEQIYNGQKQIKLSTEVKYQNGRLEFKRDNQISAELLMKLKLMNASIKAKSNQREKGNQRKQHIEKSDYDEYEDIDDGDIEVDEQDLFDADGEDYEDCYEDEYDFDHQNEQYFHNQMMIDMEEDFQEEIQDQMNKQLGKKLIKNTLHPQNGPWKKTNENDLFISQAQRNNAVGSKEQQNSIGQQNNEADEEWETDYDEEDDDEEDEDEDENNENKKKDNEKKINKKEPRFASIKVSPDDYED